MTLAYDYLLSTIKTGPSTNNHICPKLMVHIKINKNLLVRIEEYLNLALLVPSYIRLPSPIQNGVPT